MKHLLIAMSFLIVAIPALAANPVLICKTDDKVEGWDGGSTNDFVFLTAYVDSDVQISKAQIKGAFLTDIRDLQADKKYKPVAASYRDMNRFGVLEDAWHFFRPLLPKNLTTLRGSFTGYIQITGEDGYKETLKLGCFVRQ